MSECPSDLEMELMAAAVPREFAPAGVNVVLLGDALQIALRHERGGHDTSAPTCNHRDRSTLIKGRICKTCREVIY